VFYTAIRAARWSGFSLLSRGVHKVAHGIQMASCLRVQENVVVASADVVKQQNEFVPSGIAESDKDSPPTFSTELMNDSAAAFSHRTFVLYAYTAYTHTHSHVHTILFIYSHRHESEGGRIHFYGKGVDVC
jgi:hypothetical protein